jgi:hypothetical protein
VRKAAKKKKKEKETKGSVGREVYRIDEI